MSKSMFKVTKDSCEASTSWKNNHRVRNTEDLYNFYSNQDHNQDTIILTENKEEARAAFDKACKEAEVSEYKSNNLVVFPAIEFVEVEIDEDDMETEWDTIDLFIPEWNAD